MNILELNSSQGCQICMKVVLLSIFNQTVQQLQHLFVALNTCLKQIYSLWNKTYSVWKMAIFWSYRKCTLHFHGNIQCLWELDFEHIRRTYLNSISMVFRCFSKGADMLEQGFQKCLAIQEHFSERKVSSGSHCLNIKFNLST